MALDIANGDCTEISDVTFENINVEYNCFDTEGQYQNIQISNLFVNGKKLSKSDTKAKFEGTEEINF